MTAFSQADLLKLQVGIEKAKQDWAANPENTGTAMVAIELPTLEGLVNDLIETNAFAVQAIVAREASDAKAKAIMQGAFRKKGKRKK